MLKLPTTEVPFPAVYNARWVVFSIWRRGFASDWCCRTV